MLSYYVIIPIVSALLCIAAGIFSWHSLPASLRLLTLEACISVLVDVINPHCTKLGYPLHYPFLLVDFLLAIYIPYSLFPAATKKYLYRTVPVIFIMIWLFTAYRFGVKELNSYVLTCYSLLITITYLALLYTVETSAALNKLPVRLLCLSFVLYHCGTFPLFTLIKLLINSKINITLIDINTTLDTTKYLLLSICLLLFRGNKNTAPLKPGYDR